MNLLSDYLLEDSLDPGNNRIILSAFKDSLQNRSREQAGVFAWKDKHHLDFEFIKLSNLNSHDTHSFNLNDSNFNQIYFNKEIISIYHSHIDKDPTPSNLDIEISKSFKLPSLIFSTESKQSFLYYPDNYVPEKLKNRIFIPLFQDCVSFVKDFYLIELGINLAPQIYNWSRPRRMQNETLINSIKTCFYEVELNNITNNDIILFNPSVGNIFHMGIYTEDEYVFHHPFQNMPKKELFQGIDSNRVYKLYRYKDL